MTKLIGLEGEEESEIQGNLTRILFEDRTNRCDWLIHSYSQDLGHQP